jgi:hypothetical protein
MTVPATKKNQEGMPIEFVGVFLENQREELEVRKKQIELDRQHDNNMAEYSKKALEAQLQDNREDRHYKQATTKYYLIFGGIVVFCLLVISVAALHLGKEQFALEIFRAIFYGGFGAVAGKFFEKGRRRTKDPDENSQNNK